MNDIEINVAGEPSPAMSELWAALLTRSPDAMLYTSPDGTIYAANRAACQLFGSTEAEICAAGRNGLVDIDDAAPWAESLSIRATNGAYRGELSHRRADGTTFPAQVTAVIVDAPGTAGREGGGDARNARSIVTIRDISHQVAVEQRIHDSVIPGLFAAAVALEARAAPGSAVDDAVAAMQAAISELRVLVDPRSGEKLSGGAAG